MKDQSIFLKAGNQAVILFHSLSGKPKEMRRVAEDLFRSGYTVYVPLFSGHGTENMNDLLEADSSSWFAEGLTAYDELKAKGYDEIAVFGLSLGGIVATYVSLHRPVVVSGTFSSPMSGIYKTKLAEKYVKWYQLQQKQQIKSAEEVEHRMEQILLEITKFVLEMKPHLKEVEHPFFIAQGTADEMIHPDEFRLLKNALVNAKVEAYEYENAPHIITIGRSGAALRKDLLQFLEKYF